MVDKPDKPYLTLVDPERLDPTHSAEHDQEFLPLPFYPWDERPSTLALDHDEVATAIHLADGDLIKASNLLKTPLFRIKRSLNASPRLQRIRQESLGLNEEKAVHNVIASLEATDLDGNPQHARREWATTKMLQSKLMSSHPLSPAPAGSITSNASLTLNAPQRTVTFRWRTAADALSNEDDG